MYAAKAICALIGSIITALFAANVIPVGGVWHTWMTVICVIATTVATYAIPNKPPGVVG